MMTAVIRGCSSLPPIHPAKSSERSRCSKKGEQRERSEDRERLDEGNSLFNPVSTESQIMLDYVRSGKHSKRAAAKNDTLIK